MSEIEKKSSDNIPESFLGVSDEFKEWFWTVTKKRIVPDISPEMSSNQESSPSFPRISAKEIIEREHLSFEQRYGMEDPDPIIPRWNKDK